MSVENEIIHSRLVFHYYREDGDELLGCLLHASTFPYKPGNMQKHFKDARTIMRYFLRKHRKRITLAYYTETYEIEKRNDLPASYAIKSKVSTEYLGRIGCEEVEGERLWYWSYWHDGNMSEVHWRQEVNNT